MCTFYATLLPFCFTTTWNGKEGFMKALSLKHQTELGIGHHYSTEIQSWCPMLTLELLHFMKQLPASCHFIWYCADLKSFTETKFYSIMPQCKK